MHQSKPNAPLESMVIQTQLERIRNACNPNMPTTEACLYQNHSIYFQYVGNPLHVKKVLFIFRATLFQISGSFPGNKSTPSYNRKSNLIEP